MEPKKSPKSSMIRSIQNLEPPRRLSRTETQDFQEHSGRDSLNLQEPRLPCQQPFTLRRMVKPNEQTRPWNRCSRLMSMLLKMIGIPFYQWQNSLSTALSTRAQNSHPSN